MINNVLELKKLYKDGFSNDSDDYIDYFFEVVKDRNCFTYSQDGQIISAAYVNPKRALILGKSQKIGYIGAVSTLTQFRGKNKIASVFKNALNTMYRRRYAYAAINPFDAFYYKQYGFADASYSKKIVASGSKKFDIRLATKKDARLMFDIEVNMSINFDNYIIGNKKRILKQFDEFDTDNINAYIVSKNGEPFAYYFDEESEITCYATTSIDDFLACEAIKGKTINNFYESATPYVQMRVINAYKALKNIDYSNCKDFTKTIIVKDDLIKANNICITLKVKNGKINITRSYCANITIDILSLTKKILENSRNLFIDKY